MAISFIGGGNWSDRIKPPTSRKSLTNFITKCCIEYTGFELTTLVVICTDFTGSFKSNYHTITPTTALFLHVMVYIYGKCCNMSRFICILCIYLYCGCRTSYQEGTVSIRYNHTTFVCFPKSGHGFPISHAVVVKWDRVEVIIRFADRLAANHSLK